MQYKQLLSSARLQARYLHLSIRLFHRDLIRATRHIFQPPPSGHKKKTPTLNNSEQGEVGIVKNVNNRHDELRGTTFEQFQWLSTLILLHGHTHPLVHSLPCENDFVTNILEQCTGRMVATHDNQN